MSQFSGQHAVVTGASSGIGRAIALQLADGGASLCVVGRDRERLETVARAAAEASGAPVTVCQQDLTQDGAASAIAERVRGKIGQIDVLVHSAGTITNAPIRDATPDQWDDQFETNLRAPFLLTQALLPMTCAGQGEIVFVNSSIVGHAKSGTGPYAATKHALKGLADSLREEVNSEGVRVLSIFPGQTATPMQQKLYEAKDEVYRPEHLLQPEDIASVIAGALSLPRTAEVTEINIRPMQEPA